jgi:hypothetical protein
VLAAPATADARVVTERDARDGTRAELSYDRSGDGFTTSYRDFRIRVYEDGEPVTERQLAACGRRCRRYAPAGFERSRSVRVRDLNGGAPEVLVDFDTGGGYCCRQTTVLRRTDAGYALSRKTWGPKRRELRDVGDGPALEFLSHDDRFLTPYGCAFCWRHLPHVWRFGRDGKFRDVTRRYPAQVRPSARALRRKYLRADADVKAPLAAYVATAYLLREPRTGWRLVRRAYRRGELDDRRGRYDFCPCGRAWISRLERFLSRTGYR